MKFNIIIVILIFIGNYTAIAQQPTKKKINKDGKTKEIFYVLKSNKNIKQGSYEKYIWGELIEKGKYVDNKKSGIWEYFNLNKIELKYDYDEDTVIYYLDNENYDSISRPPLYLGSTQEIQRTIQLNIKYPIDAVENDKSGRVEIKILFDSKGNPTEYKVIRSIHPSLDSEALRVVKFVPNNWIPPLVDGKRTDFEVTLPAFFRLSNKDFKYLEE